MTSTESQVARPSRGWLSPCDRLRPLLWPRGLDDAAEHPHVEVDPALAAARRGAATHTNQPASETRKRPGSAITRIFSGNPASSLFTASRSPRLKEWGWWRTGHARLLNVWLAPRAASCEIAALDPDPPVLRVTALRAHGTSLARSAFRSAAAAAISSASLDWTPNFRRAATAARIGDIGRR